jgi:hypothetical protein
MIMENVADRLDSLLSQDEGVQLWELVHSGYFIRSLRTRQTWQPQTSAEATAIYEEEVERSRECEFVQKKLGGF